MVGDSDWCVDAGDHVVRDGRCGGGRGRMTPRVAMAHERRFGSMRAAATLPYALGPRTPNPSPQGGGEQTERAATIATRQKSASREAGAGAA